MNRPYTNTDLSGRLYTASQADQPRSDRERTRHTRMPLAVFFETVAANEREAAQWLSQRRWPDGERCPHCGSRDIDIRGATGGLDTLPQYRCRSCSQPFTVRTRHFTAYPAVSLRHWLLAMRLMVSEPRFWSEAQIARFLGLDRVTTSLIIHAIHIQMRAPGPIPLESVIGVFEAEVPPLESVGRVFEADEAFWPKHEYGVDGVNFTHQLFTISALERESRQVRLFVASDRTANTILRALAQSGLGPGCTLYSDGLRAYLFVATLLSLSHGWVNHSAEYVKSGQKWVHINGAESVFAWMRHALGQVELSQQNLPRYVTQAEYLFNRRQIPVIDLMRELASREHGSLTPERLAVERSRFRVAPDSDSKSNRLPPPLWLPLSGRYGYDPYRRDESL